MSVTKQTRALQSARRYDSDRVWRIKDRFIEQPRPPSRAQLQALVAAR